MRTTILLLALITALGASAQRIGVVLSGGGASALSHIGVLKALEENHVPIDYITGSSMGALVGALYASGVSPLEMDSLFQTELYQLMAYGGVEPAYTYYFKQDMPDASMLALGLNVDTALQLSLPTNLRSPVLIDHEQMRMFAGVSAAAKYDMDSLFVPYRCVASDVTARQEVVFSEGDLAMAVRASMSYPFYFKPIQINGHLMMDGGMYNNFPADVMYEAFMPDYIIGSNVAYNAPPPTEDDLMGQLKSLMTQPTDYVLPCDPGVIIEPNTTVTIFDFDKAEQAIAEGYAAAMAAMPTILAEVHRRQDKDVLAKARTQFRSRSPAVVFGDIRFNGLNKGQSLYCERLLNKHNEPITDQQLKPRYFRLYADNNVGGLFPQATYVPERGNFDLDLWVKRERPLEVRFGGLISSRPVNAGMISARYNIFGRTSSTLEGTGYFGKFYTSGRLRWRTDLSSRMPIYLEPSLTLNRWDHFSGFTSFFQEVRPSYIVRRELWGGANAGMALGNKGLLRFDGKYAQTKDSYYQSSDFVALDTADVTEFKFGTAGLALERNSLNRKQQPNNGEMLRVSARYIGGAENTLPGSRSTQRSDYRARHDWVVLKATLDKYFLPRGHFKFGIFGEGVYSAQPFFQNYTGTLLQTPVFQPTPESRTYFLEKYRASQYLAGGARTIIAVARNKFDLRLEGYVFQPYKTLEREPGNATGEGEAISSRYFLASGSLIYQTPLGPLWFNTSYFDGLRKPWVWSVNFGYVIFSQSALE
ncbi:MAG: patatin-like phospholipase family protein [Flavobacteriales bacterium]|nr:patatin-like phospholipase family protein [Flavobacteriales bacterium]MBP9079607.1 patatin-like phospholipase family protein [Flavobacteriales bacterium]